MENQTKFILNDDFSVTLSSTYTVITLSHEDLILLVETLTHQCTHKNENFIFEVERVNKGKVLNIVCSTFFIQTINIPFDDQNLNFYPRTLLFITKMRMVRNRIELRNELIQFISQQYLDRTVKELISDSFNSIQDSFKPIFIDHLKYNLEPVKNDFKILAALFWIEPDEFTQEDINSIGKNIDFIHFNLFMLKNIHSSYCLFVNTYD